MDDYESGFDPCEDDYEPGEDIERMERESDYLYDYEINSLDELEELANRRIDIKELAENGDLDELITELEEKERIVKEKLIEKFKTSDTFSKLDCTFAHFEDGLYFLRHDELREVLRTIDDASPFIIETAKSAKESKSNANLTFEEFITDTRDEDGTAYPSLYAEAMSRYWNNRWDKEEKAAKSLKLIPAKNIVYPVDKVNSEVWNLLKPYEPYEQLKINLAKRGSKKPLYAIYSINFDELESNVKISKTLTEYDKRVYIAAGSLYDTGNEFVTISAIYKAMGNKGNISSNQRAKIFDSITKMQHTSIHVDDAEERQAYGKKVNSYNGYLLPIETVEQTINGNPVKDAIHFFREPPLLSFARNRKQITTFKSSLLETGVSQTETSLSLEDYLLQRIAAAKRKGVIAEKILLSTAFERTKIKAADRKQRQRAKVTIEKILNHYKSESYIEDFSMSNDSITVSLKSAKKAK